GEEDAVRRAHAAWLLALVESLEWWHGGGPEHASMRLEPDLANLRAALAWLEQDGDAAASLSLAAGLWIFWLGEHLADGRRWRARALGRSADAPAQIRVTALAVAGLLALNQGDYATSRSLAEAVLEFPQDQVILENRAIACFLLGNTFGELGDY